MAKLPNMAMLPKLCFLAMLALLSSQSSAASCNSSSCLQYPLDETSLVQLQKSIYVAGHAKEKDNEQTFNEIEGLATSKLSPNKFEVAVVVKTPQQKEWAGALLLRMRPDSHAHHQSALVQLQHKSWLGNHLSWFWNLLVKIGNGEKNTEAAQAAENTLDTWADFHSAAGLSGSIFLTMETPAWKSFYDAVENHLSGGLASDFAFVLAAISDLKNFFQKLDEIQATDYSNIEFGKKGLKGECQCKFGLDVANAASALLSAIANIVSGVAGGLAKLSAQLAKVFTLAPPIAAIFLQYKAWFDLINFIASVVGSINWMLAKFIIGPMDAVCVTSCEAAAEAKPWSMADKLAKYAAAQEAYTPTCQTETPTSQFATLEKSESWLDAQMKLREIHLAENNRLAITDGVSNLGGGYAGSVGGMADRDSVTGEDPEMQRIQERRAREKAKRDKAKAEKDKAKFAKIE
jgi:hypothetical protein